MNSNNKTMLRIIEFPLYVQRWNARLQITFPASLLGAAASTFDLEP